MKIHTIAAVLVSSLVTAAEPNGTQVTEREVRPIFQVRCFVCHGKRKQEGGLDLRTQASRLKGGESGPALVPGKPDEILLIQKIESNAMPPPELQREYSIRSPTEAELKSLRSWIATGCPPAPPRRTVDTRSSVSGEDRNFWAFQPPRRPQLPPVQRDDLVANPIDAFVLSKLEEKDLAYSRRAEPLTLLRRVTVDLTGMPPSPAEIEAYLGDRRPDAYERLVDRLLGSPGYGERWARHWLDLAGYSDSEGFGFGDNVRHYAWRFRDYVIRALNNDKPYDRFLTEQLAGDELADHTKENVTEELVDRLAATGFLRTAPDPTFEPEFAFIAERMNVVADEVQVVTSALMGLTVGCARCHDHKYDPVSQRDYYRMTAILETAYDPYDWLAPKNRRIPIALDSEIEARAEQEEQLQKLEQSLEDKAMPYRVRFREERPDGGADKEITLNDLIEEFEDFESVARPLRKEIGRLRGEMGPEPYVRALVDTGGVPSTHYLLARGDPLSPTDPVEPGVPAVLTGTLEPYEVVPPWTGSDSSGRRLAFARWLTQPDHPLTARVLVNQLWQRHFGRGLVPTPENFGRSGEPPTHPALLDWLATELVRRGWSLKAMHRLIVTSAAYRQSSRKERRSLALDPDNALLSRMSLRRMEAEQLYDSILKAAGRLDERRFGPPQKVDVKPNKEVVARTSGGGYRRSIYLLQRHTTPVTLLDAFDLPERTPNCLVRRQSNVPTQALQMMNGSDLWNHASFMAGVVMEEVGEARERQVEQVYLRALCRPPRRSELHDGLAALEELERGWRRRLEEKEAAPRMALASLCHTIFNSAEFLFID